MKTIYELTMKYTLKLAFMLLLTAFTGINCSSQGQAMNPGNTVYTLYSPLNFTGTAVECNSYLTWQKPQLPDGTTPAGLAGYYIYRDGIKIGESIAASFDDEGLDPTKTYTFMVKSHNSESDN